MRNKVIMLIITVVAIVGTFIATVLSDSRPVLGLDLQGGISIVLFPVKGTDLSGLNTATTVIRNRVDGLGIAEPDVQRQGDTIVVNLPGVKDRAKAERLVGETAELRFRPVVYSGFPRNPPFSAKPRARPPRSRAVRRRPARAARPRAIRGRSPAPPAPRRRRRAKPRGRPRARSTPRRSRRAPRPPRPGRRARRVPPVRPFPPDRVARRGRAA